MRVMSSYVVARGVGSTAAGVEVITGARPPARGRTFPGKRKRALVVVAVTLLALLAALISTAEAPDADHHSSAASVADQSGAVPQMSEKEALNSYEKLPLSFIPNEGQASDEAVRYYAQGAGYGFFFTKGGAMLSFTNGEGRGHALGLSFLGTNPDATLEAQKRLSGEVNYLMGDDPAKWQQGLPTHGELLYGGLWPGIDMAVRGEEGGKLKYEFHMQPGSSVEDIRLGYRGAERLSVGTGGELLVQTSLGVVEDAAPVSYQRIGGERVEVESRYKLTGDGGYGFAVGAYDPRYPLVIDPGLDYSTFLGGGDGDRGWDIALRDGRAYVTGDTSSTDYPTTTGAFDTTYNGVGDAFVTKLNASGSALAYSTFLGGTEFDQGQGIAVDGSGRAYVTGNTSSTDYPTTTDAFDTTLNSNDAFVTKLNASGSALAYSTFLGGTSVDFGNDIAVDGSGSAHVTGQTRSADYPTTTDAFDRTFNGGLADAFVTKLNASGSALAYSTFLGGTDNTDETDQGLGIAVRNGTAYVTGEAAAADFPTTTGAYDTSYNGGSSDVFVTKLNAAGSALAYSTFLGGTNDDIGWDITVRDGRAHVTGQTAAADYPTTTGAFDRTFNGGIFPGDAFVSKLNAAGSALAYSTFLGGTFTDRGESIAVDGSGRAYVTGFTLSTDYPTTRGAFDRTFNGEQDAFVTKLNASGSALAYSTFLGGGSGDAGLGIAVDGSGRAYVTGNTSSTDFPTTTGAYDTTHNGASDAFVTKLPTG
jgi:hypothetical protein